MPSSSSLLPASFGAIYCFHRPRLAHLSQTQIISLSFPPCQRIRSQPQSILMRYASKGPRPSHGFLKHRFTRWHSAMASSLQAATSVDGLPPKLVEIVKLFQMVPEPRAKYEQLLHYGKTMKPLAKEYQTLENKVQGCVSQVWVRAYMDDEKRIYFEADSDSMLTKGLSALLVEGFSGSLASEILRVSPEFIQTLGLNQSLTPSRSNGFLNMLKLMQKKTLELAMEAERENLSSGISMAASDIQSPDGIKVSEIAVKSDENAVNGNEDDNVSMSTSRQHIIRRKLETALDPIVLDVEDISYQHAGHAGVQRGASETHFNLKIVSPKFEGKSLIKRHRLVYDLLQEELQSGLHALSIVAKTPAEAEKA